MSIVFPSSFVCAPSFLAVHLFLVFMVSDIDFDNNNYNDFYNQYIYYCGNENNIDYTNILLILIEWTILLLVIGQIMGLPIVLVYGDLYSLRLCGPFTL